jgi:RNA polymerase sigma-70 factor, ECF subfamily
VNLDGRRRARLHGPHRRLTIRWMVRELRDALIDAIPDAADDLDLAAASADVAAAVAARWPAWVDPASFAGYLAARLDPALAPAAAMAEVFAADLYLACACVRGVAAAHAAFEREYVAELPAVLRAIDASRDRVDEALQLLREKMLVARDGPPRLEAYSGHGPLGAWLRVSATRIALSLRRREQPLSTDGDDLATLLDPAAGADIRVLAARIGADLRAAMTAAIAAQPARTRAVMRLYYADGHGVEDIGRVYRVHASSVSRWLAKARADILARTRAELCARLTASTSEIDSLLGHAASIEISVGSLLRSRVESL